jgi:CBS domain-containing protein
VAGAAATSQPPAQLVRATVEFLRKHAPFDEMDQPALALIAERARLGYYPKGAIVLAPERGAAKTLFIVQRGLVRARAPDAPAAEAGEQFTVGEMFSISATLATRPPTRTYEVLEDLFCYELDADTVQALLRTSPRFARFCTLYTDSLLQTAWRTLRARFSAAAGEDRPLMRPLSTAIQRAPVTCPPDTRLRDALGVMQAQRVGAIIIVGADGAPRGIFTERDLVRHAAAGELDSNQPISAFMTPDPFSLPATATLYEAALAMAQRGIRHLLVCEGGALVGVISERSLFALQRLSLREVSTAIDLARDVSGLTAAAGEIRSLARSLLAQGVNAEPLTQLIATLNDRLTERVLTLEAVRHELGGIRFCWLALGSEGRHEQTFASDQDNAIIFESDGAPDTARARLLPFARAVNETLDACGFPLCAGEIMARNPKWCLAAAEWRERFGDWVRNPDPQALLNANIFFDFRPLWGEVALAHGLHDWLSDITRGDQRFLRMMAENALLSQPPLGFFGDFLKSGEGAERGTIDLKIQGTRVFSDAARVFALAAGTTAQNTAARLRHAGAVRHVPQEETEAVIGAFYFLVMLRLQHQHLAPAGQTTGNRIDPHALNELDRQILKEALRQARKVQKRLALDYQLRA